ncbi:ADP-ribosylglycohydrolase family protein [Amycolatopsis anabasis]|uniref:ADP-ribosylglycohydrolase family protein n=1 Tax=Amycolatopsis anabasis TaxID=1840409 RepID=UPI00131AB77D|nr:ADP-ribosylglycohydrolase family protein [Amycolatopsis anabasis]
MGWSDRFLGSMLAGAVGDALGEGIEFESLAKIRARHGARGLRGYDDPRQGRITDDTQMTLFTLEGLIRAHAAARRGAPVAVESALQHAYQRWLHTQGIPWERAAGRFADVAPAPDGWLIGERDLFHQRAPGMTCLSALRAFGGGGAPGSFTHALNDSKGCGGVMRAAPAALWSADPHEVFRVGALSAALTHSHPSGYLSAGAFAVIVRALLDGTDLPAAISLACRELRRWNGHEEQLRALDKAVALAARGRPEPEELEAVLGGGWVGEEALALAVCAALAADDLADGLLFAVNHSGDSDSTGAICGNLLGAVHGPGAIPGDWLATLELRETVERLTRDALAEFGPEPPRDWAARYPSS